MVSSSSVSTTPAATLTPTAKGPTLLINNASNSHGSPEWFTFLTNNSGVYDVEIIATSLSSGINYTLSCKCVYARVTLCVLSFLLL